MLILVLRLLTLAISVFSVSLHASSYLFSSPSDPVSARQSSVYHISQDNQGFIWFASDTDGLLRFDGNQSINWLNPGVQNDGRQNINTFLLTETGDLWVGSWRDGLRFYPNNQATAHEFPVQDNNPHALSTQRIQTLFRDSKQRIWVGTIAGVYYINPEQPLQVNSFAFAETTHPLYQQRIWGIAESPDGLWFATSKGIVLLDPQLRSYKQFFLPSTDNAVLERAHEVRTIEFIHQQLWAGSANGVFNYQPNCQCFIRVSQPGNLPQPRVNALHSGTGQKIWVGATDGLYQLDSQDQSWTAFAESYNLLPDVDIRSIYLDQAQHLWLGSREQGVFIGTPQYTGFVSLAKQMPETLAEDGNRLISAIYHDQAGGLWLAAQNNLLYRHADKQAWLSIELRKQFGIRKVYRITADPAGQLWFATDRGLYRLEQQKLVAVNTPFELAGVRVGGVTELYISAQGHFYLGLWQHGLVFWQPEQQLSRLELSQLSETSGDQIYQLSQSQDGHFFAVSRYSGLFTKASAEASWRPLPIETQGLVDGYNCVLPERDKLLWLCSEYGLWRYDRQSKQIEQFSIQHGLPSSYISAAFFDQAQRFWVLTNHGPARFDERLQRFVSYSQNDGLPDLTMQRNTYSVAKDGETLIGTANGAALVKVMPEQENLVAPQLVLSKLIIDGADLTRSYQPGAGLIELPHSYRELIIGYALIDYRNPEMNTTRSRLLGLSDRWSPFDKNHEVRYINLPPGRYVLEIEGQNGRGVGTDTPLRLTVVVKAPWWYSTWLWLIVIVLVFMLVLGLMHIQQLNLSRRNRRLQQLVLERTSELEALTVKLKDRADHDSLTGLLNRAGFIERFQHLLSQASRLNHTVSLVLIDIDHFKLLNDQYGHNLGDKVLQHFSALLQSRVRASDILGRWGGEEFILALTNTDAEGAKVFCDQLLQVLKLQQYQDQQHSIAFTATFGVVNLPPTIRLLDTWVKLADDALYQGKRRGRAQVVIAEVV